MLIDTDQIPGGKPGLNIARALTMRYLIALVLVASLSTAAWFSQHLVIKTQESMAAVVNVSGRQRMLSQRTALFSNLLTVSPVSERSAIRTQLKETIELMARSHQGLIRGDKAMGLPVAMSDTVHAMYFEGPNPLDVQVSTYVSTVNQLLQLNDDQLKPGNALLQSITSTAATTLLTSLDGMVRQYQLEGEASVRRLEKAETAFWLATLSLLVLEALLIFRPFIRHTRMVIGKLQQAGEELQHHQDQLEDLILQRTAEVERGSKELMESEEKFRLISTAAQDAIVIIDANEQISYCNPSAEKIFGYSANEIISRNIHDVLAPLAYREAAHRAFDSFRYSGQGAFINTTFEISGLRKDGVEFPIELAISAVQLQGNWHAVGIIRDITERKASEGALRNSEERLRLVLEGAELGFWDWNILTGEVKRNERWAVMLGYSYQDIENTTQQWADFVHPDDREKAWHSIYDVIEGRSTAHKLEYRMLHKDGGIRWILDQAKVMQRDANGKPIRMSGIHIDITDRKLKEKSLKLYQFSLNRVEEGALWVGKDAKILDVNESICRMLGYSRDEMLKLSIMDIDPFFPIDKWQEHWLDLKLKGTLRFESMQQARNGTCYPAEVVANYFEYDSVEYSCAFVRDITERKRLEAELQLKANIDYLTGVSNRGFFMEQAEQELIRALRYANPLSFFMLDIDFFKRVNDTHGHKVGDDVLKQLVEVCRQTLRHVDIIGRVGGEEFAIILPETDRDEAIEVAERLRGAVASVAVALEVGSPLKFTVSIGVASLVSKDSSVEMLLNAADKALYAAKGAGRNRVCNEVLIAG